MPSHVNYFEPYERAKGAHHENDLTRAFLALLRLSPMVMGEFFEQLRDRLPDAGYRGDALLPHLSQVTGPINVSTQKGPEALDSEREWLVSVLMTDEELELEGPLEERGRRAVYDGVITLGDHVITLENKPHGEHDWREQLNPRLPEEGTLSWPEDARPVVLPWKDMIQAVVNLRDEGRLDPTAGELVSQFQRYVLTHFDYLNPYPTFGACHDSRLLINRRCGQILQELCGEDLVHEYSGGRFFARLPGSQVPVRRFYIYAGTSEAEEVTHIVASVWPSDLVSQARPFYRQLDRDSLMRLREENGRWHVTPNLHLSYRGDHLVFSARKVDLGAYLDYWIEHGDLIRRVKEPEMRAAVDRLRDDGWLGDQGIQKFEEEFAQTRRNFVDICPGVHVETSWPIDEGRRLDGAGSFTSDVRNRFEPVFALWRQDLPDPEQE